MSATPEPPAPTPSATTDKHLSDGLDCWCSPLYLLPCDECDGTGCWKCERGSISLTRTEAEAATSPIVVVHNR